MKDNIIETERLLLQHITAADNYFVLELVNTPGWLTYIGDRNIHTLAEATNYLEKIINNTAIIYWTVFVKATKQPIGIISFIKRAYLDHPDIGFAFLPNFIGKGYAYEAATKVIQQIQKENTVVTLLATTVPNNHASIKLLQKLGFVFENEILQEETLHIYKKSNF
jgi:[ribosomal protein S5]-alanine N-acetyltransferase